MNVKSSITFLLILITVLVACIPSKSEIPTQTTNPPTLTLTATIPLATSTQTKKPTAKITIISPTETPSPSPTIYPEQDQVTPTLGVAVCPARGDEAVQIIFDESISKRDELAVHFKTQLLDYLNQGGNPEELQKLLNEIETPDFEEPMSIPEITRSFGIRKTNSHKDKPHHTNTLLEGISSLIVYV